VSISVCAFKNRDIDISKVTLSKPGNNCGHKVEDGNLKFQIPTSEECGTQIKNENDQFLYSNKIHSVVGEVHGVISRSRSFEIDFSCSLKQDKLVSLTQGITPLLAKLTKIEVANKEGSFDVSMGLFTNDKFDTQVTDENFSVNVPEPLFIGLELSEGGLVLDATKCWATPSDNPEDALQYIFVEKSCSAIGDEELLEIDDNGTGTKVNLKLASFSFLDDAEAQIFIHCDVHLCDPDLETCEPDCSSGRRRRRSANSYLPPIAIGPVHVRNPQK